MRRKEIKSLFHSSVVLFSFFFPSFFFLITEGCNKKTGAVQRSLAFFFGGRIHSKKNNALVHHPFQGT